jgi:hypothetical protein
MNVANVTWSIKFNPKQSPVKKVLYNVSARTVAHCKEILIYVFPEKELRGLSPNFHIYVSVSGLNIPRIGPQIFLQQIRHTHRGNI